VFSPRAWLKLQYLCHRGETEIGAFGISAETDPLYVEQVVTVRQRCSAATVAFDDEAVADFFDDQVDQGLPPWRFGRIWLHTHPGDSPMPSSTDEVTFARVFGNCDWAVMFILARGGNTYCRAQVSIGAGPTRRRLRVPLEVSVDYSNLDQCLGSLDPQTWAAEYDANVEDIGFMPMRRQVRPDQDEPGDIDDLLDWFDALDPTEQEAFLEPAIEDEDPFAGLVDERAADPAEEVLDAD
jgi:hypothetical protein